MKATIKPAQLSKVVFKVLRDEVTTATFSTYADACAHARICANRDNRAVFTVAALGDNVTRHCYRADSTGGILLHHALAPVS